MRYFSVGVFVGITLAWLVAWVLIVYVTRGV